jgi:hypothetical protein
MQPTTLKELEWIHDCVLTSLLYDISNDAGRSLKLTMRCPEDLGYAPWNGKTLVLTAIDVAIGSFFVCSVEGPETIDAVRAGISSTVRESTTAARRMGARFPNLEFSVSFHSGSELEIICQEIQIDVRS